MKEFLYVDRVVFVGEDWKDGREVHQMEKGIRKLGVKS